jgi:hypothetical protein
MVCYVTSQIWKEWQCFQYSHNLLGSVLFILAEVSMEAEAFIRLIILVERMYRPRANAYESYSKNYGLVYRKPQCPILTCGRVTQSV